MLSCLFEHKVVALLASAMCCSIAQAEPATTPPTAQAGWPKEVVVNVGEITTRIDGAKLWTLSGIDFDGMMMATQDSAYGCVLTIRNVGHLGTAHFLDVPGKPGEIEKENVSSLKFFVNDKPVESFKPEMTLTGDSFRMERKSTIRTLGLDASVQIRDGILVETAHLHATGPLDLQKAHPTMYAFSAKSTVYLFGDDSGITKRGTFQTDKRADAVLKDYRWMAQFDPASGKGSICYLATHPADAEGWFILIDVPEVYRKLALYTFEDRIMPTGYDGTYQTAVAFFKGTEKDWEQQALKRLAEVKKSLAAEPKKP